MRVYQIPPEIDIASIFMIVLGCERVLSFFFPVLSPKYAAIRQRPLTGSNGCCLAFLLSTRSLTCSFDYITLFLTMLMLGCYHCEVWIDASSSFRPCITAVHRPGNVEEHDDIEKSIKTLYGKMSELLMTLWKADRTSVSMIVEE